MSGIFFDSTGGSLMNRARPFWPGHGDRHPIAADRVARQKLLQRVADQFGGLGAGLAENLGILDVVEGVGDDSLAGSSPSRQRNALSEHCQCQFPRRRRFWPWRGPLSVPSIGRSPRTFCDRRQLAPSPIVANHDGECKKRKRTVRSLASLLISNLS